MSENDRRLRELIAENIAYYRKQNGDTQAELAEKLNYSDKSISKWERGDGTPDIFILNKIATLYHISVQDFLREKKVAKASTRHLLILLLSLGLAWFIMTVVFCVAQIFDILPSDAWLLFIYALPICGILCCVFSSLWYGHLACLLSSSLIIWGVGLSIVLTLRLQKLWLLLIICAVLQILLVLYFQLLHQSDRRNERRGRQV